MRPKHSCFYTVLLVLFFFTFACDSSPQKSEVEENTTPATKMEKARPINTTSTTIPVHRITVQAMATMFSMHSRHWADQWERLDREIWNCQI